MAHYAIGDLQGCFSELGALLNIIGFNHGADTLWLVGDIVNRGPQSLECLQFCMQHESSVQMVLGNHDLHLLALMHGFGKLKRRDTVGDILQHQHTLKMRDWLRNQPLMLHTDTHVLVHAGLLPQWTVAQAQSLADEVADEISGCHANDFFAQMYGNSPNRWQPETQGLDRLRFTTNVLTRMRVLNADGSLDYDFKEEYQDIPADKMAWFDAPNRQHLSHTIVFGHWSALGYRCENGILALDTGALWGDTLTAVNLQTGERFTQPSFQPRQLLGD
ncbi:symmetrical bis(5'-nucleosyl)-tetraphosphatase [Kingella negevensis]|uniref:bis(5'-nucleosyl)-tetraphosphatase (symmetrical) n=1 Tax=Kingella negevensis TaxID=1522312 RepID=A0A238TB16_9NEIS|nr:symmetrical bis(5'-nucleosyl)-tetraphosphatase [Kingella negevensis]MDK4679532.1 symmetrical bis(5'-nucleosyl)-tetraphosphatase [Kingella negevensis]MDK4682750.1 symmetrical bis(5'-nucleosyl)-tetraphosphatase [Kingella negevensis]MDK4685098.1 symmetrical bis(5'-nucleosyl)-tetraphosphatase [Kingella negevensis]MDK4690947.1 symmetrical bis(5'-nucleosyl)-tetraphosphatase [Kingella negevensis]MDK4693906.1 symmetrical bis(5'-nucleosyl)-tetraphosphatase [Kingella negevensis]